MATAFINASAWFLGLCVGLVVALAAPDLFLAFVCVLAGVLSWRGLDRNPG